MEIEVEPSEVETLKSENEALKAEIAALMSKIAEMENGMTSAKTEISEMKAKVEAAAKFIPKAQTTPKAGGENPASTRTVQSFINEAVAKVSKQND